MASLCMVGLILLGAAAAAQAEISYTGYQVVGVTPQEQQHQEWLAKLEDRYPIGGIDFWTDIRGLGKEVRVMLGPALQETVKQQMEDIELPYLVLIEDVQSHMDAQDTGTPPGSGIGVGYDFKHYLRYKEIELWLENLLQTSINCQTELTCSNIVIGQTHEGRDQHVVKISSGGAVKRKVWIDGGIHAREWVSPTTAMYMLERLVTDYMVDSAVTTMLDTYDFYILPVINADGYEYTHTEERLWRKSRTLHEGDACYGTDVNRNFDHMWMSIGASPISCSQTYAGPFVHSEVESVNMATFILNMKGQWEICLTLHSYSQLWMAPWGYTTDPPANYAELMRVGEAAVEALYAVHGTVYEVGSASEILYASSGTSRDWAHGTAEIPFVFTVELRDTGAYGFELPEDQILPTAQETWAGFRAMTIAVIQGP